MGKPHNLERGPEQAPNSPKWRSACPNPKGHKNRIGRDPLKQPVALKHCYRFAKPDQRQQHRKNAATEKRAATLGRPVGELGYSTTSSLPVLVLGAAGRQGITCPIGLAAHHMREKSKSQLALPTSGALDAREPPFLAAF